MDKKSFCSLLLDTDTLSEAKFNEITLLVQKFPWAPHIRLLELSYLQKKSSELFIHKIRNASFLFPDRNALYDFINSDKKSINQLQKEVIQYVDKQESTDTKYVNAEEVASVEVQESQFLPIEIVDSESAEDLMSIVLNRLNEIASEKEVENNEIQEALKKLKFEQIDRFIESEPVIRFDKNIAENEFDISEANLEEHSEFVSETLANLLVKQHKYEQAIEIYKQLMLNNPKKSSYFANQIKNLQNI